MPKKKLNLKKDQERAVRFLQEHRGKPYDFKQLNRALGIGNTWLQLRGLAEEEGLIEREKRKNGGRQRYVYWVS